MDSLNDENKNGSGKNLKVHFDLPGNEDDVNNDDQRHSTSSISSKSSIDSDNSNDEKDDINSIDNLESNVIGYGSPVWSFQSGSVTQSPPVPFMNPTAYDPNRIPSSIFASKPTSPMDWSVASNESLFSIHLGNNNSLSRDHSFFFKSGELPRTNDMLSTLPPVQEGSKCATSNNDDEKRHSLSSDSSDDISDVEDEHERTTNKTEDLIVKNDNGNTEDLIMKNDNGKTEDLVVKNDNGKTETSEVVETSAVEKTVPDDNGPSKAAPVLVVPSEEPKMYTATVSYRSMESDMSNHSFQFPILTADIGRTSSETVHWGNQHRNEKQKQHEYEYQQPEPVMRPPSPQTDQPAPKKSRSTNWCCFSCCCCFSSCF